MKLKARALFSFIPISLIGLTPFSILDNALLEVQYELRGARQPALSPVMVKIDYDLDLDNILKSINSLGNDAAYATKCVVIEAAGSSFPCLNFKLEALYEARTLQKFHDSLETYLNLKTPKLTSPYQILFYGNTLEFPELSLQDFFRGLKAPDKDPERMNPEVVVFVPKDKPSWIPIKTPMGAMSPAEISTNIVANVLNKMTLKQYPRYTQFLMSIFSGLIVTWLVYYYPTALTLIFASTLCLLHFFLAMFFFDKFSAQIPVAAPFFAGAMAYLLSVSEKLDSQERKDWATKNDHENFKQIEDMRNNFLSLVSHDLKTPIAKIQASLERFLRGDFGGLSSAQKESLQKVLSTSGHLQRSISTLLLLGRVESKKVSLKRTPSDLAELIRVVAGEHASIAEERKIEIIKDLEPLFLVDFDPALIREVISNLLDNALKYSPTGGKIYLRCGESENAAELSPPQPGVWFEIQDEGPGIHRQDRPVVLQKFVRGKQENTPADQAVKGTGLGLFLCNYFVEKHGGHLELFSRTKDEFLRESDPAFQYFSGRDSPSGTVVRVTLPIDTQE